MMFIGVFHYNESFKFHEERTELNEHLKSFAWRDLSKPWEGNKI